MYVALLIKQTVMDLFVHSSFSYILVNLLVDLSLSWGGGGLQNPENPFRYVLDNSTRWNSPGPACLWTYISVIYLFGFYFCSCACGY